MLAHCYNPLTDWLTFYGLYEFWRNKCTVAVLIFLLFSFVVNG